MMEEREYGEAEELLEQIGLDSAEKIAVVPAADECVNHGENIAVENDWLEMRYVKRDEVKTEEKSPIPEKAQKSRTEKPRRRIEAKGFLTPKRITAAVCILLVVAIVGVFVFGGNSEEWFTDFKAAALTVFGAESPINRVTLSATTDVDSIAEGDVIIKGGRLVLTLCDGVVANVTDNSVSVQADSNTLIVYSGMKDIGAVSGQIVRKYDILGRYEEMSVINVYYRGVKITDIVEADRQLIWKV